MSNGNGGTIGSVCGTCCITGFYNGANNITWFPLGRSGGVTGCHRGNGGVIGFYADVGSHYGI